MNTTTIAGAIKTKARQGDVYLINAGQVTGEFKRVQTQILAYGEVTGHKHEVVPMTEDVLISIASVNGKNFIRVTGGKALLKHEEHHHIELPPGDYEYRIQREFDPVAEQRRVQD